MSALLEGWVHGSRCTVQGARFKVQGARWTANRKQPTPAPPRRGCPNRQP